MEMIFWNYLVAYKKCTRRIHFILLCAQVYELLQSCCGDNWEGRLFVGLHIYLYIWWLEGKVVWAFCVSCGLLAAESAKIFPGPGHLCSKHGIVLLWHLLVNLYIYIYICIWFVKLMLHYLTSLSDIYII